MALLEPLARDNPRAPDYARSLGTARQNLAALEQSAGHAADAERDSLAALAARRALAEAVPGVPAYRHELAQAVAQRAVLLQLQNRLDDADATNREAAGLFEKLLAESPGVPDYLYDLASAENNRAGLAARRGNVPEAVALWTAAADRLDALAKRLPDRPLYPLQLGRWLTQLAITQSQVNQRRAAIASFDRAAAALRGAGKSAEARRELARTLNNRATLLAGAGQIEPARRAYTEAVEMLDAVAKESGGEAAVAAELCDPLANRARTLTAVALHREAADDWSRVAKLRKLQFGTSPTAAGRAALADALTECGFSLREGGDPEAAAARFRDALAAAGKPEAATTEAVRRAYLGLAETQLGLDDAAGAAKSAAEWVKALPTDAPTLVNAAAVLAQCSKASKGPAAEKQAARAVELLRDALKSGVKDAAVFEQIAGLAPLRGRADYKQLLGAKPR